MGFEDPLQGRTILRLGPDDPIEKPTDFLLGRLAVVRRRIAVIRIPFALHFDLARTGFEPHRSDPLHRPRG